MHHQPFLKTVLSYPDSLW